MKMPKKMKAKWLKALRSGEYGQLNGTLTDGNGNFCCLGVLQHCVSGGEVESYDEEYGGNFKVAPSGEWYMSNGIDTKGNVVSELMELNDCGDTLQDIHGTYLQYKSGPRKGQYKFKHKFNFKQIAKVIEEKVETY